MSNCLSNDPYCAKNPPPFGSYEAYRGELCGACEQWQEDHYCKRCKDTYEEDDFVKGGICGSCADDLREDAKYEEAMRQ